MTPQLTITAQETALRTRLGIPSAAQRVLVLGESSHWDPNWLLTSQEYYQTRVERILDQALAALVESPERVYSVESVFFLRMYDERRPERRSLLRKLLNERRLRLVGGAVSSPDTLVTPLEGLLRDYLIGAEWLRSIDVSQEARCAYYPDNFGHSPCLPNLLRALSIPYAGITRIDGMYFPGTDYRDASHYPTAGSSAERLLEHEHSLTFRWQAPDASEVLCHWNAFGYGHGDLLGHVGLTRWMGLPLAASKRATAHIVRQVDELVSQLAPLSRTPYLFCPIGFDFVSPIRDLCGLIGDYNRTAYPSTGTFVVNGGLDDYLDLAACHSHKLPVLTLDPNPYWMGFYASRPQLKRSHWDLVQGAVRIEAESALASPTSSFDADLRKVWDAVAFSNHHDFVTGTSPDRVFLKEQKPLLAAAQQALLGLTSAAVAPEPAQAKQLEQSDVTVRRDGTLLCVDNGLIAVRFDGALGGAIDEVRDLADGTRLLGDYSHDLTVYRDGGGLWRMGHEIRGGRFSHLMAASEQATHLSWERLNDGIIVTASTILDGHAYVRSCRIRRGSRFLYLSARGDANDDRTICARFTVPWATPVASMGCAGGVIDRESFRHYAPTFWPAQSFVHFVDPASQRGMVLFPRGTASVSFGERGALSYVVQRTARLERAWGVLPVLGFPAAGREYGAHEEELAITWTRQGDWRQNRLSGLALAVSQGHESLAGRHVSPHVAVDDERVSVSALKRAANGRGYLLRLLAPDLPDRAVALRIAGCALRRASRCDALERDLEPLALIDGALRLRFTQSIESVRVELA